MKPRSKIEKHFCEMAESLPPVRKPVREWAYSHCFNPVALWWKHRGKANQEIWCQCCGHREPCDGWLVMASDVWVCPECGARCEVKDYKTGTNEKNVNALVSTIDVFKGVQVVRTFEALRENRDDGKKTRYNINEVYQIWMLESGREIVTTRRYTRSPYHFSWDCSSLYSIGKHNAGGSGYYYFDDVYNVNENWMYPRVGISPFFRQRGMDSGMVRWFVRNEVNIPDAFCALARDPRLETLLKTGYLALFAHFVKNLGDIDGYWRSINICHRQGYAIDDAVLWCDHIDMLQELGMDVRSPKYICPENLHKQHAQLSRRLTRKRDREKLERDIKKSARYEKKFLDMRSKFFGLLFRGEHVTVLPIRSVKEVAIEGTELHHCVFAREYYRKPESLLLSARDNTDNSRVETVEVDLRSFRIVQSRGYCNHDSPFHSEIMDLVQKNIPLIREAARKEA